MNVYLFYNNVCLVSTFGTSKKFLLILKIIGKTTTTKRKKVGNTWNNLCSVQNLGIWKCYLYIKYNTVKLSHEL